MTTRTVIRAPLCEHCDRKRKMRMRHIEKRIRDQLTFCWRCDGCETMTYVIVELTDKRALRARNG